ncbi:E3 ubiquitin-protein ligase TRIM39-like isoform X1 [Acipenser ruthenus]|uniref:E3 ubiquitin-protein ligase TRIM39-like isoform X1 n=1 Tax=Acipenser ruthenus TaxID=7906 RepID=UPI0027414EE4|nr:E3 ubiquitin-protein ligase TRIM39-like isoform X1 [Acipenser ruthenus]XP_058870695.1 E3 ubiquitin-protein ligase TRIM39-like isoform X1 [Acipenser ruthenus]
MDLLKQFLPGSTKADHSSSEKQFEELKQENYELKKEIESLEKENAALKQEHDQLVELKQVHDQFLKKFSPGGFCNTCFREKMVLLGFSPLLIASLIVNFVSSRSLIKNVSMKSIVCVSVISNYMCCCEPRIDHAEILKKLNVVGYVTNGVWQQICKAKTEVTLNPDTAGPGLAVNVDDSLVKFTGEREAEWPSVLGREVFTSGRHYWEVEVGEKGYWAVGVSTHPGEKIIPEKPEEGYWLVRLSARGRKYEAVGKSLVTHPPPSLQESQSPLPLTLEHKLYKVGMYLNYWKGELSFYNLYDADNRYAMHTFKYNFTEVVYPVFSPGCHDKAPLKITRFDST